MFETPSLRDRELEALTIHQNAYKQSLGILSGLPQSDERAKTIAVEVEALRQVEERMSELKLVTSTPKPA
jgi:hypothetical protein